MDLSKIQIVALCVITTILTDKFIVNHQPSTKDSQVQNQPIVNITTPSPVSSSSATINSQNEIILRELINLRQDMSKTLTNIQQQSPSTTPVPSLSQSLLGGMVKISSSQWKRVNVYQDPSTSSKITNSIVYDVIYFYRQKQTDWYQLDLDNGQTGWVQSQFLKEFP